MLLCTCNDRPDLPTLHSETPPGTATHLNKPCCLVGIKRARWFGIVSCFRFRVGGCGEAGFLKLSRVTERWRGMQITPYKAYGTRLRI